MTVVFLFSYLLVIVGLSVSINYQLFPNVDRFVIIISLVVPLIIVVSTMSFMSNIYLMLV